MTIVIASKASIQHNGKSLDSVVMVSDSRVIFVNDPSKIEVGQKVFSDGSYLLAGTGFIRITAEAAVSMRHWGSIRTPTQFAKRIKGIYKKMNLYLEAQKLVISGPKRERIEHFLFPKIGEAKYPLEVVTLDFCDYFIEAVGGAIEGSGRKLANQSCFSRSAQLNGAHAFENVAETMLEMYVKAVSAERNEKVDGNRQWAIQVRDGYGRIQTHALYPEALNMDYDARVGMFVNGRLPKETIKETDDYGLIRFYEGLEMQLKRTSEAHGDYLTQLKKLSALVEIFATGNLEKAVQESQHFAGFFEKS
ncbi:hypothetical protein HYU11_00335 [Candidatus Woesearchaeota archaeon]|nr:hypothetical protein [Candidatus Woesearchaeota archaeon]